MIASAINYLKKRQLLPVLTAFTASIILIILPASWKISLSQLFIQTVYSPLTHVDKFLTDVVNVKKNNTEMSKHLIRVSVQAAQYTEDHFENIRLRRMLNFDLQIPYRLVPAEVICISPGSIMKSFEINTGTENGVNSDMPVMTADGIVGKIIEVTNNTAIVQMLVDHNCRISVIDQNTRAMGIIRWQGGKFLEMSNVPIESKVVVGDTIVSSGLGEIFPPGLMVGTVIYSKDIENTLFKDIMVKPTVDFGSLEEVFVVVYDE